MQIKHLQQEHTREDSQTQYVTRTTVMDTVTIQAVHQDIRLTTAAIMMLDIVQDGTAMAMSEL